MNIYISHSSGFDFKNELYKPIKEFDMNNSYTFFFPHENEVDKDNIEVIKSSDLVIAEVSFPSTGQGIEIGIANASNVPIVCISKEGVSISNSLKYVTDKFITYGNREDLIYKISEFLSTRN